MVKDLALPLLWLIVTAVAWLSSLAQELLDAIDKAKFFFFFFFYCPKNILVYSLVVLSTLAFLCKQYELIKLSFVLSNFFSLFFWLAACGLGIEPMPQQQPKPLQ